MPIKLRERQREERPPHGNKDREGGVSIVTRMQLELEEEIKLV